MIEYLKSKKKKEEQAINHQRLCALFTVIIQVVCVTVPIIFYIHTNKILEHLQFKNRLLKESYKTSQNATTKINLDIKKQIEYNKNLSFQEIPSKEETNEYRSNILHSGDKEWIKSVTNKTFKSMLYHAGLDNLQKKTNNTIKQFHKNCDNKSPLVILLQLKNLETVGGYVSVLLNDYEDKNDTTSFIFSLSSHKAFHQAVIDDIYIDTVSTREKEKGVIISFGSDLVISETEVRSSFPVSYGSSESKLSDLLGLVPEYAITSIEVYQME